MVNKCPARKRWGLSKHTSLIGKRRACPGFLFSAIATGFAVVSAPVASVAAVAVPAPAFFKIFTAIFCTFYRFSN
jgi:hypothetical protein